MLAFPPKVGVAMFAKQRLPPMQTSKHEVALMNCQGEVEDPPRAAVQHKGQQLLGKIRVFTWHKLKKSAEELRHYNEQIITSLRIKFNG